MGIKGKELIIIERKTWGADDEFGNPVLTFELIEIKGCLIAWGSFTESADLFGVSMDTTATLQLPQNTPTQPSDVFILPNGKRYVQDGNGAQWVGQRGNPIKQKKLINVVLKEGGNNA